MLQRQKFEHGTGNRNYISHCYKIVIYFNNSEIFLRTMLCGMRNVKNNMSYLITLIVVIQYSTK